MTYTNDTQGKIITRIRKLMSLANGGASEAEAEQAMKKAHALLAEHNLSIFDVSKEEPANLEDRVIDSNDVDGINDPWRRSIWHATAALHFCKYFYSPEHEMRRGVRKCVRIRHNLVGRPHNVLVTKLMVEYLINTVRRLAGEHTCDVPASARARFAHSFRVACTERLVDRIWERHRRSQFGPTAAHAGTTLPALRSIYASETDANQALLEHRRINLTTKGRRCRTTDVIGAEAGRAAADEIGLDNQVTHCRRIRTDESSDYQMELPI